MALVRLSLQMRTDPSSQVSAAGRVRPPPSGDAGHTPQRTRARSCWENLSSV